MDIVDFEEWPEVLRKAVEKYLASQRKVEDVQFTPEWGSRFA